GQWLESEDPVGFSVAAVAARVPRPLLQENRLNTGRKEVQFGSVLWSGRASTGRSTRRSAADPICHQLPFRVLPRLPEFAASVCGISSLLSRKRMEQQATLKRC